MGAVIPTTLATALADAAIAAIDAGGLAARIAVYAGTLPTDLDPGADVLLLELDLAYPSAAAAVAGVATFDVTPAPEGTVLADGTPGYFIIFDSDDVAANSGKVGLYADPDADLVVDSLTWLTAETVSLDVATLTMPTS